MLLTDKNAVIYGAAGAIGAAVFAASDQAAAITGTVLNLSGGSVTD